MLTEISVGPMTITCFAYKVKTNHGLAWTGKTCRDMECSSSVLLLLYFLGLSHDLVLRHVQTWACLTQQTTTKHVSGFGHNAKPNHDLVLEHLTLHYVCTGCGCLSKCCWYLLKMSRKGYCNHPQNAPWWHSSTFPLHLQVRQWMHWTIVLPW